MANISKVILLNGQEYILRDSTLDGKIAQEVIDRNAAIAEAIRGVTQFDYQVVTELPATGVKGTIYLVPKTAATQDIYDEYIWVNNAWEHIGSTAIDLSNYYNKTEVDGLLATKGTYSKPSDGIPKSDLASAVQTSLGKADTALQDETYKGTVTKVSAGTGLTGGDITSSGTIAHSTDSGYKHIPSGGTSGKVLGWKADGEAQWVDQASSGMQLVPGAVQNNIATYDNAGQVKDSSVSISGLLVADDAGSAADPNPINADTLNGHAADYFLTSENVIDALTSTSTTEALSANQGRILNENITDLDEAVSDLGTAVEEKAPIESPSFTGTPTVAANTSYSTAMMRNVILSTSEPTSSQGSNGDICIVYTA